MRKLMTGAVSAIIAFVLISPGTETPAQALAHHAAHANAEADAEVRDVFDDQVDPRGLAEEARDGAGKNDAHCIASDAMDRAADALLPQRRDKCLVGARPEVPCRHQVDEQAERSGVDDRGVWAAPDHQVRA
jgi:hypothetical protein